MLDVHWIGNMDTYSDDKVIYTMSKIIKFESGIQNLILDLLLTSVSLLAVQNPCFNSQQLHLCQWRESNLCLERLLIISTTEKILFQRQEKVLAKKSAGLRESPTLNLVKQNKTKQKPSNLYKTNRTHGGANERTMWVFREWERHF